MSNTMIEQLPKYKAYRDSGVEWLGHIPSTWQLRRFKYLLDEVNERSDSGKEELLSVSQYTGVTKKSDKVQNGELLTNAASLEGYKIVRKGYLVSNIMLAWNGSLGVSPYNGITSPAYSVYRFENQCLESYYHYLLRTEPYKAEFKRKSTGVIESRLRLYSDDFFDVIGLLPPYDEQISIATFLDKKTSQIDEAIAIKQKQIELLKERKQIIIQQAVTQGLNPDAPMKDSGVDWVGIIPEHWSVKKLRYLGNTQNGISAGSEYFGEGYPFVSYGDVYKNRELPTKVDGLAKSTLGDQKLYSVLSGDVFFTRTSETADEIGFASTCFRTILNATFAGFLIRFRPDSGQLTKEYSKYYFNAPMLREYFVKEMNLVIRASLSQELLKNLMVVLPPEEEQLQIFEFLEAQSSIFDNAVDTYKSQIEKLKEYKTTLINSAVTGKIKVTELA
ncbi:TPA: restriction endonuclease subunit S [Vibrio mimicus]